MLLDMIIENLDFSILVLILGLSVCDNLICHDPQDKASRIIKIFTLINNQKREVNSLLTITMRCYNINKVIRLLWSINFNMSKIIDNLDENSKTKPIRESLLKQKEDILILIHLMTILLDKKIDAVNTGDVYDDVIQILKLYRPIYTKIYQPIDMSDILL